MATKRKVRRVRRRQTRWLVGFIGLFACIMVVAAAQVAGELRVYHSARDEYAALRLTRLEKAGGNGGEETPPDTADAPGVAKAAQAEEVAEAERYPDMRLTTSEPRDEEGREDESGDEQERSALALDLAKVNPDYAGWIILPGTDIDYPVVQGTDNDKYLHTTFEGKSSKLGTPFIDIRSEGGLDAQHIIIYGHNARDGSMFGPLTLYQDETYRAEHPELIVTRTDGAQEKYQIFAVRATDTKDKAYRWSFNDEEEFSAFAQSLGAPEGTYRILTLSTCIGPVGGSGRLLVIGALTK